MPFSSDVERINTCTWCIVSSGLPVCMYLKGLKTLLEREKMLVLFPQCFQRSSFSGLLEPRLYGKGLTLSQTSPGFYVSAVQVF